MAQEPTTSAHWRDSAKGARFFFIDATAAFPMLLFLVHIKIWTFIIAMVAMTFFTILNRFGYSVELFLRMVRSMFAGSRKMAIPWWSN